MNRKLLAIVVLSSMLLLMGQTAHADLNDGLLAYWSFDACDAKDDSGNGHDGSIQGNLQCVQSNQGKAFYFDGNASIALPDQRFLDGYCNMTLSAWVTYQANDAVLHQILFSGDGRGGMDPLSLQFSASRPINFGFEDTINLLYLKYDNIPPDSIYLTNDVSYLFTTILSNDDNGSVMSVYLNDKLVYRKASSSNMCIGYDMDMLTHIGSTSTLSQGWIGYIDEVRIYGRAISDIEVSTLYAQLHPNSALTKQSFNDTRMNTYKFTLPEASTVAILSAGPLDLKGTLKNSNGKILKTNGGYKDIGKCNCSTDQELGRNQKNFMLRANLGQGSYSVEVRPQTATTPVDGNFSTIFLTRPSNSDGFFAGLDALLSDGYGANDYFDIYVKALYPEYYGTVNDLKATEDYGHAACYESVCKERQSKALTNFFLEHILAKPYLLSDDDIRNNWLSFLDADKNCRADDDFMLQGDGDLVFDGNQTFGSKFAKRCGSGKYCYNPETGELYRAAKCKVQNNVVKGDVFVQRLSTTNHYGLVYDGNNVIDANIKSDGLLRKGKNSLTPRNTSEWKVARPQ